MKSACTLPKVPRCKKCNTDDHSYRDCPRKNLCNICDSEDHVEKDCPSKLCMNCFKPNHTTRECTVPQDIADKQCDTCLEMGHMAFDCTTVQNRDYHIKMRNPVHREELEAEKQKRITLRKLKYENAQAVFVGKAPPHKTDDDDGDGDAWGAADTETNAVAEVEEGEVPGAGAKANPGAETTQVPTASGGGDW